MARQNVRIRVRADRCAAAPVGESAHGEPHLALLAQYEEDGREYQRRLMKMMVQPPSAEPIRFDMTEGECG